MDREKLELIELEIRRLPPCRRKESMRLRQYEDGKRRLAPLAATRSEYEDICRAVAQKYRV